MVIKAILLDIDNTLIDYMGMKRKSCDAAIKAMLPYLPKTLSHEHLITELYNLYETYSMDYDEIFQKLMKQESGRINYRALAHGVKAYRDTRETVLLPYPGVIATIKKLKKKYKVAIISDAPAKKAWERLVAMKIDGMFDVVITMTDVRKTKKSKVPFTAALKQLEVEAGSALMVGDNIDRDVRTAKRMGIKTCYAKYGHPEVTRKSNADYEIDSFDEVLDVLKKV